MTDLDLRMIDYQLGAGPVCVQVVNPWRGSGYFSDLDQVMEIVASIEKDESVTAIYTGLNPCDGPAGFRRQYAVWPLNGQISRRRRILIDADPLGERPVGQSSTEQEHQNALDMQEEIRRWLRGKGIAYNSMAGTDSANGAHTILFTDWLCDGRSDAAVVGLMAGLSTQFTNSRVGIDTTVSDRRRVTKLYGSLSRKGQASIKRPHRRSHVLQMPELEKIELVPLVSIERIVADHLDVAPASIARAGDGIPRPAAQEKFVRRFSQYAEKVGAAVTNVRTLAGGKVLIETSPCLLHDDHDGAVGVAADGVRCVQCFHVRCSIGWARWASAVEEKFKRPMLLDGEIRWKK